MCVARTKEVVICHVYVTQADGTHSVAWICKRPVGFGLTLNSQWLDHARHNLMESAMEAAKNRAP